MWSFLGRTAAMALTPEGAHGAAIWALKKGAPLAQPAPLTARMRCAFAGLRLDAPVGLAAGFDKNAEVVDAVLGLGAGFVEIGAVTPRPQAGNPKPRLFRLQQDAAIINRLGFNNEGMDVVGERLRARRAKPGVVGVNIGANANSVDRMADYETVLRHLWGLADFFTVNVSSPNTKDLRALQEKESLTELLSRLVALRDALAGESGVAKAPVLLKIAPDLDEQGLEDVAAVALETQVDGVIATNTTISRPESLRSPHASQKGGLSGRPIFQMSTEALRRLYARTEGKVPLIGVGGVETGDQALMKIRAGASLVQLYTGLVYHGPRLFADIHREMDALLGEEGVKNIAELIGVDAKSVV